MIFFILGCALLLAIAIMAIAYPLWHSVSFSNTIQQETNKTWYFDRLKALSENYLENNLNTTEFEAEKIQLQKDFLSNHHTIKTAYAFPHRILALVCVFLLLIFTYAAYHYLGSYQAFKKYSQITQMNQQIRAMGGEEGVIAKLKARLKIHPNEAQGWYLLGRIEMAKNHIHEASIAFKKAAMLQPQQSDYSVALAEAAYLSSDQQDHEKAATYLQKALQLAPHNMATRNLLALTYYRKKHYQEALVIWQDLLTQVPPDSEAAQVFHTAISNAQQALATIRIPITITLAPTMQSCIKPHIALLVYAKAAKGRAPMPLAITKLHDVHFPLKITLDDTMSMTPAWNLHHATNVLITARLTESGQAIPQRGDCEGVSQVISTLNPPSETVITIDQQHV